jgi:hypothetical protein
VGQARRYRAQGLTTVPAPRRRRAIPDLASVKLLGGVAQGRVPLV